MINRTLIYIVCTLILVGCNSQNSEQSVFPESVEVAGHPLQIGSKLGRPYAIHVADDYLIVRDDGVDTKLTVLKLGDFESAYHFGKHGEGPDELINPGPIFTNGNSFCVYDGGKRKLLKYRLDSIGEKELLPCSEFQTNLNGIISLEQLSDSAFVATGVFPDSRFCLINTSGNAAAWLGKYPIENQAEVPFHVTGMAFQSAMTKQQGSNRVAVATRYGGILQVFDFDWQNKSIKEIGGITLFSPELSTKDMNGTPNFRPNQTTKWGYLSVASTEKYIYALYSGRYQREGESFHSGNEVHVFDWDGKPLCLIHLDRNAQYLAATPQGFFALCDNADEGYDVVEYNFPNIKN